MINYSEFLAATVSVKQILTHEKLEALFIQFDIESRNQITAENIIETLKKMGRDITVKEIQEIMNKHDKSNDGAIQFDEFKMMLLEDDLQSQSDIGKPENKSPDKFVLSKTKSIRLNKQQRI